jgi:ABC-type transporter Mla subunit MlaD
LKRWLALLLGVGLAAAALFALSSARLQRLGRAQRQEIDAASRAKLERVIRTAGEPDVPAVERR